MTPADYQPALRPFMPHQREAFELSADREYFALLCEPRTRKTKVIADTARYLFLKNEVDALVVVAMPEGVHRAWVTDELPLDLPADLPWRGLVWRSAKARTKALQLALAELAAYPGLAVVAVNGEAVLTEPFRAWSPGFFARRKVLLVADETTLIMKNPARLTANRTPSRTGTMLKLGALQGVVARRILDGTPVGEGPLDLFAPFQFLSPSVLGYSSYHAFKQRYALWETGYASGGRQFRQLQRDKETGAPRYVNLDELAERMAPHSYRCRYRDVFHNPEKIYQKGYFELTPEQRRVYDELEGTYEAELRGMADGNGGRVSAAHVLTRYLRLQQVASNYWPAREEAEPCGACGGNAGADCAACGGLGAVLTERPLTLIDPMANPRLENLEYQLRQTREPVVTWCRFRQDVDQVMELCAAMGRRPVRYDGACTSDEKDAAKAAMQTGDATDLVGSPRAGGRGVKLNRARTIIYFSNEFSLLSRLQSEERAEDPENTSATGVVDLVAEGTVDEVIVAALRAKRRLSDVVLREESGGWL